MSHFKPQLGQNYWMINSRFKIVQAVHTGSTRSKGRIAAGNAFKTKDETMTLLACIEYGIRAVNRRWWEFWK